MVGENKNAKNSLLRNNLFINILFSATEGMDGGYLLIDTLLMIYSWNAIAYVFVIKSPKLNEYRNLCKRKIL